MKNKLHIIFLLAVVIVTGCNSTEPKNLGKLYITTEDVSCMEAWIKVTVNDVALPAELQLFRNDSVAQVINLSKSDTVIYEDNLAPSTEYNYTAKLADISSGIAAVRTMDTTSHDFTWETYTFGGGSGSLLNDVAIVDENNIWAVGEIHTPETDQFDSNGVWVQPYNAVHWDGNQWELKRISRTGRVSDIRTIYVFNKNDIWIDGMVQWTNGELILHNDNFPLYPNGDGWRINAMWGISSSDFYAVGDGGNIAHYNGSRWTKIESRTDVELKDIYGSPDGSEIWISGSEDFKPAVLIKLNNNESKILFNSRDYLHNYSFNILSGFINSVWTDTQKFLYILTTYDLYRIKEGKIETFKSTWRDRNKQIGTLKVRGDLGNNIFTIGYSGSMCHYNGKTWKTYFELSNNLRTYYNISVKNKIVIAVGYEYENGIQNKAILTINK